MPTGYAGRPRTSLAGACSRSTDPIVRLKEPATRFCFVATNVRAESVC